MPALRRSALCIALSVALAAPALAAQAEEPEGATTLAAVEVTAESQVALAPAYAGGQIARGARAGLLGNLDFLDAPYAQAAYTAALAEAQQADSVGDVLQNDPTVRVAKGFGNFQEVYVLRGFPVYSDDITLNGVFGVLPRQYVAAELLERVEVFRGANAFLNGAAPGGSGVGGSVNLVPKRAPAAGVRRATVGVQSGGEAYAAVDVGQRAGAGDAWGLRVNAVGRNGEGAIDAQERRLGVFSLGTDYAGERLRFSADLGLQDQRLDAPRPQVTPLGRVPRPPSADVNFAQPWTYTDERQAFGVLRGELDVSDTVAAWLGLGARRGDEANVLANPSTTADGRTTAYRFDNAREDEVASIDAGVSADVSTGAARHRLVLSASAVSLDSRNAYAFSSFFAPFAGDLYRPFAVAAPAANFFTGGRLDDPRRTEATDTRSVAVADAIDLLDGRMTATLGLRQQRIETRSFDYNSGALTGRYADDAVTPSLGLLLRASERLSLYGNYAESLQPGQIAPANSGGTVISNAGEVLAPFRGEQVELGLKFDGGDIAGTAALFRLTRPNAIVVGDRFTADGEQRSTGLELSLFGEPVEGFRVIGGLTVLDAEQARTQNGVNEGRTPIGVPELQANLNLEWDVAALAGLTLDARVVHTGAQPVDAANTVELGEWTRLDLGARYAFAAGGTPVTLRLRVENVADTAHWTSVGGFPGANYLILGAPRTVIASASFDF
jgi:iron complex outermembrane receptor protein